MSPPGYRNAISPTVSPDLRVSLHVEENGPAIADEPVLERDLVDARSEAWLNACLRAGRPLVPMEEVPMLLEPIRAAQADGCTGFALSVDCPDGGTRRQTFSLRSVEHVATRAAQPLIAEGVLEPGAHYFYRLHVQPRGPDSGSTPESGEPFSMQVTSRPPVVLRVPLSEAMKDSRPVAHADGNRSPVLYTEPCYEQAERCARKGAADQPPVETGAVLIGSLCTCPESGEFFVVAHDVLEVTGAHHTEHSLSYSDQSWARIQANMRARQAHAETRSQRIVGQCHGHNFLPAGGAPPCEACWKVPVCTRTSVFVSSDDLDWSRAVFSAQPWQLCHIFGLNARGDPMQSLFGLRDGALLARGFHLIAEFDTTKWPIEEMTEE